MCDVLWIMFNITLMLLLGFAIFIPIMIGAMILAIKSDDIGEWIDKKCKECNRFDKYIEKPVFWILDKTCKKQINECRGEYHSPDKDKS